MASSSAGRLALLHTVSADTGSDGDSAARMLGIDGPSLSTLRQKGTGTALALHARRSLPCAQVSDRDQRWCKGQERADRKRPLCYRKTIEKEGKERTLSVRTTALYSPSARISDTEMGPRLDSAAIRLT